MEHIHADEHPSMQPAQRPAEGLDTVANLLSRIARGVLVGIFGLIPLLFLPVPYVPIGYAKTLCVIIAVSVGLIFVSLAALRSGSLRFPLPVGLGAMWVLVLVSILSALLSGDMRDAFIGEYYGIHTVAFLGVLALIMTSTLLFARHKGSVMKLYMLLTASGVLIGLYYLLRVFFGADTLALNVFSDLLITPIGSLNDLALFFGLSILLALVAIEQFPLTAWGRGLFALVTAIALCILSIVNFFSIWLVLGLVSLILLMFNVTRKRLVQNTLSPQSQVSSGNMISVVLSIVVLVVSAAFLVGGSYLGQHISNATGVSYVEVRPSFEATFDIVRNVYSENAILGVGPNKFADAWRLYKDPAINQTIFWNTLFEAGVGYVPTYFVTTGLLGGLAWIIFLLSLLYAGYKIVLTTAHVDRFWYFIGISSFVSAVYLWGMSIVYVPGTAMLMLAALFSGLLFTAYGVMVPQRTCTFSLSQNRNAAFLFMGITMVLIVGSVSLFYVLGRHYVSTTTFNKAALAIGGNTSVDTVLASISRSFDLMPYDSYARESAQIQILKLTTLLGQEALSDAQTAEFEHAVVAGINAGQLAVAYDGTEARNHMVLGAMYSILAAVGVEGAHERAQESFATAQHYDPTNPQIKLLEAQLESRTGNVEEARTHAQDALRLKSNYTDALLFLTQLDIAAGNIEGAIESARASITLEPRNPARYYQLGVLYSSAGRVAEAITAFEQAVSLDTNYANARYFLAFAYDEVGRSGDALTQLQKVLELNPGNESVEVLISELQGGGSIGTLNASATPVREPSVENEGESAPVNETITESNLLTPVNTIPDASDETEAQNEASGTQFGGNTATETSTETADESDTTIEGE